jgi:hypothetical protein
MSEGISSAKRLRLPPRRASETFGFEVGGLHYYGTISRFTEDGRVAEIFLSNHRSGSQADANARDAAVAASLAFQYGCPLEVLRGALLRDMQGSPATPLGIAARHRCAAGDGKRAMIKVSHSTTSDIPDGRPWPPPDNNALWVVVRRAYGCTLWRAIELAESELPRTFANSPIGSN